MTPRLNAPGRLGDPMLTLSLLRARSLPEARALAARVEQRNDERKAIEARVTEQAIAQAIELYGAAPASGIVLAAEGWHRGVIGISAARVSERFGVPAVVIGVEAGHGHGSCRAPDGFPLFDAIARCAAHLTRFGGHQAASGLALPAERVEAFRADFAAVTAGMLGAAAAGRRRRSSTPWSVQAATRCRRRPTWRGSSRSARPTPSRCSCCPRRASRAAARSAAATSSWCCAPASNGSRPSGSTWPSARRRSGSAITRRGRAAARTPGSGGEQVELRLLDFD